MLRPSQRGGRVEVGDLEIRGAGPKAHEQPRALMKEGRAADAVTAGQPVGDLSGVDEESEDFVHGGGDIAGKDGRTRGHGVI